MLATRWAIVAHRTTCLVTLSISSLHYLDTEANKLYDRARRLSDAEALTTCYTPHALYAYNDSEIYHIRH